MTAHARYERTAITPATLSVSQAAAYLGISRSSMYRLSAECGTGQPLLSPVHVLPGRRVFLRKDLDAYLESCRQGPARKPA